MILLSAKPLFSSFQLMMMMFIFIGFVFWLYANISHRYDERKRKRDVSRNRHMRIVDRTDTLMSSDNNRSFKN